MPVRVSRIRKADARPSPEYVGPERLWPLPNSQGGAYDGFRARPAFGPAAATSWTLPRAKGVQHQPPGTGWLGSFAANAFLRPTTRNVAGHRVFPENVPMSIGSSDFAAVADAGKVAGFHAGTFSFARRCLVSRDIGNTPHHCLKPPH